MKIINDEQLVVCLYLFEWLKILELSVLKVEKIWKYGVDIRFLKGLEYGEKFCKQSK
ncbi:MAG: hypothetical protein F6K23_35810 [Okeania sp. SIO2C9]|uniref:hypothetical protein n=1 Tax=Okeania sp. SIO2C9 TaxID=2607791 RepID=UPI0013C077F8|nr:hypothetical protein [Okeania sp. SIO2C9]NEQ77908.1 hypothetical protein [Okeania sp. SIO2C9]